MAKGEGRIQIHFVLQTFPNNSIYLRFTLFASFFFRKSVERFISTFQKTQEDQQNGVVLFLKIYLNPYKSVYIIFQLPRGGMLTRRWKAAR